jgi:hypothetical protein
MTLIFIATKNSSPFAGDELIAYMRPIYRLEGGGHP